MAASKTFHGARAKMIVGGKTVGIFHQVSYTVTYGSQVPFILGRASGTEVVLTSQEPIQITATGYRVVGSGPYSINVSLTQLKDMLSAADVAVSLEDRVTGKLLMSVPAAKAVAFSNSVAQKQLSDLTVTFIGLTVNDETVDNAEPSDAADLPAADGIS